MQKQRKQLLEKLYQEVIVKVFQHSTSSRLYAFFLIVAQKLIEVAQIFGTYGYKQMLQAEAEVVYYSDSYMKKIQQIYMIVALNISILVLFLILLVTVITMYTNRKPYRFIYKFLQHYFVIHIYLLSLPSLCVSISFLYDTNTPATYIIPSYLTILFTFIISISIKLFSHDFSFSDENQLAKSSTKLGLIRLFLSSSIAFVFTMERENIFNIWLIIIALFDLFSVYFFQVYQSQSSGFIHSCSSGAVFGFMLFVTIKVAGTIKFNYLAGGAITMILGFHLGYLLFTTKVNQLKQLIVSNKNFKQLQPETVEYLLRITHNHINELFVHYLLGGKGIDYESIKYNHRSQCSSEICFCTKIDSENDLKKEETHRQIQRKKFVLQNMCFMVTDYLSSASLNSRSNDNMNLIFTLLCFVSEVCNQPIKALYQMHFYRNYLIAKKGQSFQIIYFKVIEKRIRKKIKALELLSKKDQVSLLDTMRFDEQIVICKQNIQQYMRNISHYYEFLTINFINLRELKEKSEVLLRERGFLISLFKELYQINPKNKLLLNLSSIYINTIDFEKRDLNNFDSVIEKSFHRGYKTSQKMIQFYESLENDCCVVYSSLLSKNQEITKVSNAFSKIFKTDKMKAVGLPIHTIIPNIFQKHHSQKLQAFLSTGSLKLSDQRRNLFGLSGEGFVFPITLKLNLEFSESEFGVCALITKEANRKRDYILFNQDGFIKDISENIFRSIFHKQGISKNYIAKYNILDMITSLGKQMQSKEFNHKQTTLLVVLKQQSKVSKATENPVELRQEKYEITYKLKQVDCDKMFDNIYSLEVSSFASLNTHNAPDFVSALGPNKQQQSLQSPMLRHMLMLNQQTMESSKNAINPIINSQYEELPINLLSEKNLAYLETNQFVSPRSVLFSNRNLIDQSANLLNSKQNQYPLVNNQLNESNNNRLSLQQSRIHENTFLDHKEHDFSSLKLKDSNLSQLNVVSPQLKQMSTNCEGNDTLLLMSPKSQFLKSKSDSLEKSTEQYTLKRSAWSVHLDVEQQSSASSVISSNELMQRSMILYLKSNKLSKGLVLLLLIGAVSFTIYLILTIVIYLIEDSKLSSFFTNFEIFEKPDFMLIDILNIITKMTIQREVPLYFSTEPLQTELISTSYVHKNYDRLNSNLNYLLSSLQFVGTPLESMLSLNMNYTYITVLTPDWVNLGYETDDLNLVQVICEYFSLLYYSLLAWQPQNEQVMWSNFFTFGSQMKMFQSSVQNFVISEFNNVIQIQELAIGICLGICIMCISFIFPLHYIIQKQNESILKLLGTFKPENLVNQSAVIVRYVQEIDQQTIADNLINSVKKNRIQNPNTQSYQSNLQNQNGRRNRQIASFKDMQKFRPIFILFALIVITMLIIQPVIIYAFMQPFVDEQKQNLQEKQTLLNAYQQVLLNISPHLDILELITINIACCNNFYFTILKQAHENNQIAIQSMQNLTNSMQIQRHDESSFVGYYTQLINGDICATRQKYPQYSNLTIFDNELCESLLNGVFQKGLTISTTYILNYLDQIYSLYMTYSSTDITNQYYYGNVITQIFAQQTNQVSFVSIYEGIAFVSEIIEDINNYQNTVTYDYIQLLSNVNGYLVYIEILILILVYLIGGSLLFQSYRKQMQESKQVFKLFHINLICQNDFIVQFFKNQSRDSKK